MLFHILPAAAAFRDLEGRQRRLKHVALQVVVSSQILAEAHHPVIIYSELEKNLQGHQNPSESMLTVFRCWISVFSRLEKMGLCAGLRVSLVAPHAAQGG
jgi:hypothetical protein